MAYVAPSTVTTLQTYTSAAHNIIVNDIIDLNTRATVTDPAASAWTTWTPTVTQGVSVTVTSGGCKYLKLGSLVMVRGAINVSTSGTAGSVIYINLPAALATVSSFGYMTLGSGSLYTGGRYPFLLMTNNSTTQLRLKSTTTTTDDVLGSGVFTGAIGSGNQIDFTAMWEVAP